MNPTATQQPQDLTGYNTQSSYDQLTTQSMAGTSSQQNIQHFDPNNHFDAQLYAPADFDNTMINTAAAHSAWTNSGASEVPDGQVAVVESYTCSVCNRRFGKAHKLR